MKIYNSHSIDTLLYNLYVMFETRYYDTNCMYNYNIHAHIKTNDNMIYVVHVDHSGLLYSFV